MSAIVPEAERERALLFRRLPLVVAHASELERVGDFVTHEASGIPLLLTRAAGGLRAFVNVCRHRATRVESAPSGEGKRAFVCPLHGWTYDLDGHLTGLPEDQGFSLVDKRAMNLVPVPIAEAFGLIWVVLKAGAPIDPRAFAGDLASDLDALDLGTLRVRQKTTLAQPLDWKLAVEAFLSCHESADVQVRAPHLRIDAFEGDPAVTLLFPNTVILSRPGEVSVFHVFPTTNGAARVLASRLAKTDAVSDAAEPPPFRRDDRAQAAFEVALENAQKEEILG